MTDTERDRPDNPPIDESTYGGSAAETGGLYDDAGPTIANPEGDTMSEEGAERVCALCARPIDIGEAWMTSDQEGAEGVAHSGCVYSEAMDPDERASWMPSGYGLNE